MTDLIAPQFPDLRTVVGEHLIESRDSWPRKGRIYPSDLGIALGPEHSGCPVAFYFKLQDAPQKETPPGTALMFQLGDRFHELIVDILKEVLPKHGWEVIGVEERVKHLGLSGRLDVRVQHTATGSTGVLDIKSKRGAAFRFMERTKEGQLIAKPADELQVQYYVAGMDADFGAVVYGDREGQNLIEVAPVERNDERPAKALKILEGIRDADEPPPAIWPALEIKENKSKDDAIYLSRPWQVEWCNLATCACEETMRDIPQKRGIVARLTDDGTIYAEKEEYERLLPLIRQMVAAAYPERLDPLTRQEENNG